MCRYTCVGNGSGSCCLITISIRNQGKHAIMMNVRKQFLDRFFLIEIE